MRDPPTSVVCRGTESLGKREIAIDSLKMTSNENWPLDLGAQNLLVNLTKIVLVEIKEKEVGLILRERTEIEVQTIGRCAISRSASVMDQIIIKK